MEIPKKKLYIFDICGTLYRSNTTYDFLKYYFYHRDRLKYLMIQALLSYPSKVIILGVGKLGFRLRVREFLIGMLQNEFKSELEQEAQNFVSDSLRNVENLNIHSLLKKAKTLDARVILLSASIEPVVKAVSLDIGVEESFSSVLGLRKDKTFSGKLQIDLKGSKLKFLKSLINLDEFDLIIYTDNFDDLPLIEVASEAFIVSKNQNVKKWSVLLRNLPYAQLLDA